MRINDVSPNIDIVPFNNDIDTLERAVKERVFFVKNLDKNSPDKFVPPPRPEKGLFRKRMEDAAAVLRKFLPSTAPVSHQLFVDGTPSRKRKLYQTALDSIRLEGLDLERDSSVSVFVKFEKTDRSTKIDPVPRVISPRDPKFNIALGRYLKPIEERIFKSLGKMFGHVTVMKGMDTDRTAAVIKQKWDMFKKPVAVGLDASRFDQHVSLEALRFEHSIYLDCFHGKHKRRLRNILKMQEVNRCVGRTPDGSLEYSIEGTRMSGDMNTSLGNCVLMCTMIKAYALHKGIGLQLANNGDDCVVFMEQRDLAHFSEGLFDWFLELGFNMAIESPSYSLEEIEFCQCRPVFDGERYTMCRNPLTAIAKDSVYLKSTDYFPTIPCWLDAVGKGGIALAGGMPVFNSFYSMYQRSGSSSWYSRWRKQRRTLDGVDDVLPWFMRQTGLHGKRTARAPTPESRCSFYFAWGVTPDEQVELERYYDNMSLSTDSLLTVPFAPRRIFVEPEDCV